MTAYIKYTFGQLVRTARKRACMTQIELAKRTELDRAYVSMMERGLRQPSITTLLKVSNALEIEAAELIKKLESKLNS